MQQTVSSLKKQLHITWLFSSCACSTLNIPSLARLKTQFSLYCTVIRLRGLKQRSQNCSEKKFAWIWRNYILTEYFQRFFVFWEILLNSGLWTRDVRSSPPAFLICLKHLLITFSLPEDAAVSRLTQSHRFSHITPLHWLQVRFRFQFKILDGLTL